ncbi:MAG: tetratricopeptide repeat protein [Phycisphaerales bacterium JB065]
MPATQIRRSLLLLASCALLGLSACTGDRPRPVFVVIESGDEAYEDANYELAAAEYREAVTRRPAKWEARMGLAKALLSLGRPEEAREQAELVYSIRPNDPEAIELLAHTMLEAGDAASMEALLRSRANDTGSADDWLMLGMLMAEAGDADAAEVALTTAATVDQGQTLKYQKALADFYLAVGDNAQALTRYRMALFIDPADESTRQAIRSLGEIPGPTMAIKPREAL